MIILCWNSNACVLTHIACVFLLDACIGVEYLSQRVHVCSLFVDNAKSVSKVDVPVHVLKAGHLNRCYSMYSPNLNIVGILILVTLLSIML